jgi:diguanylate cyclase (GGDEF)-like protein/PAS domain S-box-containing protein
MVRMVTLMVLVSLLVVTTATLLLYRAGVERERIHLQELVRGQVSLLDAVTRFDAIHSQQDHPQGAEAATLSQIGDAYSRQGGFGKSGEMLIGRRTGAQIEFLVSREGYGVGRIAPVAWDDVKAEPMRRALRGETGRVVGLDYRGETVMAAYAPVKSLNVGVVAKMDVAEVRAPYLEAGATAFVLALLMVIGGSLLLRRISNPVFEKIQAQNRELMKMQESLQLSDRVIRNSGEAIMITKANGEIIDINDSFTRITGYAREEALGKNPSFTKSDRHGREFYAQMWRQSSEEGEWRGEVWDLRKDGSIYPKSLTINAVKDEHGEVSHYIGIFSDITQNKLIEQQLQKMAFYDELTGLPNRTLCKERLDHEIKVAHRRDEKLAVLFLDLDHFKYVNDTLGHSSGDLLLVEAARRIRNCIRESDTVARLGGDEFMVVLTNIVSSKMVERIADCIIKAIAEKFVLHNHEVDIGVSIGISLYPDNGAHYDELTKNADAAMYRAKEAGRNTFMFFTKEIQVAMMARLKLEKELREAIASGAFKLHYQPRIDLYTGQIVGVEALLRWPRGDGMMMPADFIPLAEETGLIIPLGEWVLHQACHQTMLWREAGYTPLLMAVNLSTKQFDQCDIVTRIETVLRDTGLPADSLELEVTEGMVMRDPDRAVVTLRRLCKLGVNIAVDDFGTGYSSLSYLKRFPIHALKIDHSFVRELGNNRDDEAIVSAIISMANTLELRVVAEGVESVEQLEFLRRDGCDEVQGALFSRPLSADKIAPLLAGDGYSVLRRYVNDPNQVVKLLQ